MAASPALLSPTKVGHIVWALARTFVGSHTDTLCGHLCGHVEYPNRLVLDLLVPTVYGFVRVCQVGEADT